MIMLNKPKVFIIEGPDRTGKTTLARAIAEYVNVRRCVTYWHCDFTKKLALAMEDYQYSVIKNLETNFTLGNTIIIDRLWPSNVVYREVLDNQPAVDWEPMKSLLRQLGAVYVFTDCASGLARHAADKDPAHAYTDEQYRAITHRYRQLYAALTYTDNCIRYDLDVYQDKLESFFPLLGL